MKIYAISDTHLGHEKLVSYGRPENFSELILAHVRERSGDLLVHCGDLCIGDDETWSKAFLEAAYGFDHIVLVRGNHDKKSDVWYLDQGFSFVCESYQAAYFGKKLLFSHIPVPKIAGVDRNIHGHLHGNSHRLEGIDWYDPSWHLDLAPELHNYKPINLEKGV